VVDTVAISPIWSVTAASDDSSWSGSKPAPGRYSDRNPATPGLSGRKMESSTPRSAVLARPM